MDAVPLGLTAKSHSPRRLGADCEKPKPEFEPGNAEEKAKTMSCVLRGVLRCRLAGEQSFMQKANIHGKPPKEKIGPLMTALCLSVFAMSLLGPAGWILHHLPEYRKRD
ncbi:COX8 domain-containing protein [Pristis pectinata]|uniref:COX8 domain-containing protein n=1 Tax=Pristis pectinata TaxID=685728 RepID=UPI00223D28A1|nr:COX8 domain-containing protein [Pristis pectinata]